MSKEGVRASKTRFPEVFGGQVGAYKGLWETRLIQLLGWDCRGELGKLGLQLVVVPGWLLLSRLAVGKDC